MPNRPSVVWLLTAAALVPAFAGAETLVLPKVVTSASVDCSSLESIVRGVLKPGMNDQEKVIALYNWCRRTIYHYRMMGADRRDVLRTINSYGGALCGSQAAVFRQLCKAAGFRARITSGDGGNELGHTALEVWYGGRWHVIDTMSAFYVLTRGPSPAIASMADLAADPDLVVKAESEGRCGPEFLYCRKQKAVDYALRQKMESDGMREDIAWTLLVIAPDESGKPQDIRTFWMNGPKRPSYNNPEDDYGARYVPGLLDITLKPHEEYVRLWDNFGRWMKNGNFDNVGPYHTCGSGDELDPVNYRYFEPYRKDNVGYAKYAYRYFGNGWLDWQPRRGEILLGSSASNLSLDRNRGAFKTVDGTKPATLVIPVKSPYAVVEATVDLDFKTVSPGSTVTVTCLPESDAYNRNIAPQSKTLDAKPGRMSFTFDVGSRKDVSGGVFGYSFNIEIKGAQPAFAVTRVKTDFMLNMYSLPHFGPGDNTVSITAEQGALKNARLVVRYDWAEGRAWQTGRSDTRAIRSFPASYTVRIPGTKMPRMKRLTMRLLPAGGAS
jgi:hypothetical protein